MNNDLTRQVLQKVREYMAAQKMSMSEFARQTGVSKAWLSKLKHTDANLSLNTAQDLLHYMGYTLKLTREGSINIGRSRIKKFASNLVSCSPVTETENESIKNEENDFNQENLSKEADVTMSGTTTTTTTIPNTPQPISSPNSASPQPSSVRLTPGQTITVTASSKKEDYFAPLYEEGFFSTPSNRLKK